MGRSKFVVAVMLLSGLVMSGVANGLYFDIWPATVDGSMDMHPSEGYAIGGEGNFRFAKGYHHMPFMGFYGRSDGADGIPDGRNKSGISDSDDGVLLADWLVGKKAFHAAIYLRSANSTCNPFASTGTVLNAPVSILGFRIANDGKFVDSGVDAAGNRKAHGYGACCGTYDGPQLDGGENAPVAWRIGRKPYSQKGDIGSADVGVTPEWYKMSAVDSRYPQAEVRIGSAGFGSAGFGGYSTSSGIVGTGHFAFDYVTQRSDAMIVNSATLEEADCTGWAGEEEPRDFAGDLNWGEGWYAERVDRAIIEAMVTPNETTGIIECKGIVFSSAAVDLWMNHSVFAVDQGGGESGAYLAITATIAGDVDNDGCNDVVDLLYLVDAFGSATGDPLFNAESDFNSDGFIDVVDLLTLVETFGLCAE